MAAPSISIVNEQDQTIANWDAGTIQANNDSTVLTMRVWNNRGGGTAVSDLKECTVTSLDTDGGASSDVVSGRWIQVNVNSVDGNTTTWTQVGGTTTKSIRADGVPVSDGYIIKGTTNDGSTNNSKTNYCTIRVKIHVPLNATPGTKTCKLRINGYYV